VVSRALQNRAEQLAVEALSWLVDQGRPAGAALVWPNRPSEGENDPMLYSGAAGIALTLLEAYGHFGDERHAERALRAGRGLVAVVDDEWDNSSLYFGLTGIAVALHAIHEQLGDPRAGAAARRAIDTVRRRFDGHRWGPQVDLLGGNAGIALGALAVGDPELALMAVTPFLSTAEPTRHGVQWETRQGRVARQHHVSHGTLGVVAALAAVGRATDRTDLLELALAGADDVVSRDEAGPDGFLVPHSDPPDRPELIDRYNFGWCQGPAGDAQVFRLLQREFGEPRFARLVDRCWYTVTHCGLPRRLRPGFWDNNGHCCGTAGVLALACDLLAADAPGAGSAVDIPAAGSAVDMPGAGSADDGAGVDFADVLVADLADRATRDAAGCRWSNVEHRVTPSILEPRTGWAMGSAGIVRELLRYARIGTDRDPGYRVAWPDQPAQRFSPTGSAER
jgi:hypothetical protein